ncbi:MAG: putative DNA-binding domain-containing protein [Parachlamydiaceae bacterium]|nr:putative DNA-binding domain-containing protein [Parachlamydiaceae bacterium]
MSFDKSSPKSLKQNQLWFASVITQPIDPQSRIPHLAPSGLPIENEACLYIKPSPTLRPAQRIEIYSQQYWWRLLNTLHEIYPLVTRLFGYYDFNQEIGIPYLSKYPPTHWSLSLLGQHLSQWIQDEYLKNDKKLVFNAAELDWAYHESFLEKVLKPLALEDLPNPEDFSYLLTVPLYLQPGIRFFQFEYDLFDFRREFLHESPDYWLDHDFPVLKAVDSPVILFQGPQGNMSWETLTSAEMHLLTHFKNGSTIEKACEWLGEADEEAVEEAEQNLHLWIQNWILKKWLSTTPK